MEDRKNAAYMQIQNAFRSTWYDTMVFDTIQKISKLFNDQLEKTVKAKLAEHGHYFFGNPIEAKNFFYEFVKKRITIVQAEDNKKQIVLDLKTDNTGKTTGTVLLEYSDALSCQFNNDKITVTIGK